jgi:hypothetical protein
MICNNCPLQSNSCIQWPALCALLDSDPTNETFKKHIVNRSFNNYDTKIIISDEYYEKAQVVEACPYRTPSSCKCMEATCALGKGKNGLVLWADCVQCLTLSGIL